MTKLAVKDGKMVCDKVVCVCVTDVVCDRWCVTKLCVTRVAVKDGV